MRIGIIGLPNSGKTTIFNVLTGGSAPTTAYAGGTFQVNSAVVDVPDERVDQLSDMYQPKKTTYAKIEYADIAGMSGADRDKRSAGLSGELINAIGNNDALLHVVRVFEDETVPHPLENRLDRLEVSLKKGKALPTFEDDQREYEILSRLKPPVEQGTPLRDLSLTEDEEKRLRGFQFLSAKPVLIVLNLGDEDEAPLLDYPHQKSALTAVKGRLEMDIAELDDDDRAMFMAEYNLTELSSERIIRRSYTHELLHRGGR